MLKDSRKIKYTFENGLEINGTIDQIEKVANSMKLKVNYSKIGIRPNGYFKSVSKGMVKIEEMNTYHLRRALLKTAKDFYTGMYNPKHSNKEFLQAFISMPTNEVVIELYSELEKRKK